MKIIEFLNKYKIPIQEIYSNFEIVKEISVDTYRFENCFNCNAIKDNIKQVRTDDDSWITLHYCQSCNHLFMIQYVDRMGGTYKDTVIIFKEK